MSGFCNIHSGSLRLSPLGRTELQRKAIVVPIPKAISIIKLLKIKHQTLQFPKNRKKKNIIRSVYI